MHIAISQLKSSEDVNSTLHKLIQQANDSEPNYNNESPDPLESDYPIPIDSETEPGTHTARSGNNDEVDVLQSSKSDEVDKKMKSIENLIEKHKANELSPERSPYDRFLPKSFNVLHKYPEIVVGELGNKNDSDASTISDTEFENTTPFQYMSFNKTSLTTNSVPKFQSLVKLTPKNEFQNPYPPETKMSPQEKHVPESNEELKKLVDLITQNKERYKSLLKEISRRDSREQNILLEKIVNRFSEYKSKEDESNFESRAAVPYPDAIPLSSKIGGLGLLQNLQQNVVSTTYLHTPVVMYKLPRRLTTMPYLPRGGISLSRNNALQRTRLGSTLVNRRITKYSFGGNFPVRYG